MPSHQYSLTLISHKVENAVVQQRADDGYINATALCLVAGKRWHNYVRNETTGQFLRALEGKTRISVSLLIQQLTSAEGVHCTWVHPKVAIHLAQWLSADFAVQVSEWVYDWMNSGSQQPREAKLPYHLRRHMLNLGKVPSTHFSILQEMTNTLIAPLEVRGYTLPEKLMPDISQGRLFCKFLRDVLKIDTDALPTYWHEFEDRAPVEAKLYPIEVLPAFRKYINDSWLPERAATYFKERDPAALPALDQLLRITHSPNSTAQPANRPRFIRKA
ncbi:KilA-N domain-containing protein [Paracidovorax avenae]|uniref:KilA-N domain-containing protein n=1 Tax=Paracidovorax avenae TaxID=80867 RepID=UPI000D22A8AB|nr:KilA-N domain-containing protein [Paracidovorax avenae]AVT13660.1 DNA-binding protein [Paracidovorax avenae]